MKVFKLTLACIYFCASIMFYAVDVLAYELSSLSVNAALGKQYDPISIKGIKVFPYNPLELDFIISQGDTKFKRDYFKDKSNELIKYFLTALTIPASSLWVNLDPEEADRIIPNNFGQTKMGKDLLLQDYLLKQVVASIISPDNDTGREFWDKVYAKMYARYGRTDFSVDNLSKVWILPDKAVIYENENSAFIIESRMKVMSEKDYLGLENNKLNDDEKDIESLSVEMLKEIVLPAIEIEINKGKSFAKLRQIYDVLILATWFKHKLKKAILSKVYVDKNKIDGVEVDNPKDLEEIYHQYIKAFKKGVYNDITEEFDPVTKGIMSRRYFSGGIVYSRILDIMIILKDNKTSEKAKGISDGAMLVNVSLMPSNGVFILRTDQEKISLMFYLFNKFRRVFKVDDNKLKFYFVILDDVIRNVFAGIEGREYMVKMFLGIKKLEELVQTTSLEKDIRQGLMFFFIMNKDKYTPLNVHYSIDKAMRKKLDDKDPAWLPTVKSTDLEVIKENIFGEGVNEWLGNIALLKKSDSSAQKVTNLVNRMIKDDDFILNLLDKNKEIGIEIIKYLVENNIVNELGTKSLQKVTEEFKRSYNRQMKLIKISIDAYVDLLAIIAHPIIQQYCNTDKLYYAAPEQRLIMLINFIKENNFMLPKLRGKPITLEMFKYVLPVRVSRRILRSDLPFMKNPSSYEEGLLSGSELKILRLKKGITQKEISEMLGWSITHIKSLERGRTNGSDELRRKYQSLLFAEEQLFKLIKMLSEKFNDYRLMYKYQAAVPIEYVFNLIKLLAEKFANTDNREWIILIDKGIEEAADIIYTYKDEDIISFFMIIQEELTDFFEEEMKFLSKNNSGDNDLDNA